jgi:hypothetical protein
MLENSHHQEFIAVSLVPFKIWAKKGKVPKYWNYWQERTGFFACTWNAAVTLC